MCLDASTVSEELHVSPLRQLHTPAGPGISGELNTEFEAMRSEYLTAREPETFETNPTSEDSSVSELQENGQPHADVDTGLDHSMEDQEDAGVIDSFFEKERGQVNYLIDEADDVGKGANTTVSLVHDYLEKHGYKRASSTASR